MNRDELILRRSYIGASEIAAVLGVDMRGTSPAQLWLEKTATDEPDADDDTPASRRGRYLEEAIARCYEDAQDVVLHPVSPCVHASIPFLRASADRMVTLNGAFVRGWEGKSVAPQLAHLFGPEGSDEVPPQYLLQCQMGMMCYGVSTWDLTALIGGFGFEVRHYRINRNPDLEAIIIERATEFWRLVTSKQAPPTEWWKDRDDILKRLHPRSLGNVTKIDPDNVEVVSLVSALREAYEASDAADKRLDNTKVLVKAVIGDADAIQGPDWTVSWKSNKDSTSVDWKAAAKEIAGLAGMDERALNNVLARHTEIVPGPRKFGPPNWNRGFNVALPKPKKIKEIA